MTIDADYGAPAAASQTEAKCCYDFQQANYYHTEYLDGVNSGENRYV